MFDKWLLAVDLDGTLWDHEDVSKMKPPFRRINQYAIVDSRGDMLKAYEYMVKLVKWAKENNAVVVTLSWNQEEKAVEALKTLGLYDLFDYHLINLKPIKHILLNNLLEKLIESGIIIPVKKIVYIDDHKWHLEDIKKLIGEVFFIHAHRDCNSFKTCRELITKNLIRIRRT